MVLVDLGIVRAIGLSSTFVGVMLSLVTFGISFLIFKIVKDDRRQYLRMAGLIVAWAVFVALNTQASVSPGYVPIFLAYSVYHLVSIFVAIVVLGLFAYFLPAFWNLFDRKLLVFSGVFASLGFFMRIIFPFLSNPYLSLLQRGVIIIPPIFGLLMILKLYVGNGDD